MSYFEDDADFEMFGEDETLALYDEAQENLVLSDEEIEDVAKKAFEFCMVATGIRLYPYQKEFGYRVVHSLLVNDGEEITALFARQSGKTETVAVIVVGCMVILPILARLDGLKEDSRISKFKDGLWIGIFGPTYEQSGIMHQRMAMRMASKRMRETLADPEIDIDLGKGAKVLNLKNGSFVDCNSAGPQTHIEGKTYHLIICEECQDISNYKIKKSIHPMLASTNGTIVKIGTPNPLKNDFFDACERGRIKDLEKSPGEFKLHFRFDYRFAAKCSPNYRKYVEKEIERIGYESDEFRMAYRLHWLIERSQFISPDELDEVGILERDKLKAEVYGPRGGEKTEFVRPDYPATNDYTTEGQVAAIDFGRTKDSTVVTVGRVWWDNPITFGGNERFYLHIVNWLELYGDDHEKQYPEIMQFLSNYNLGQVIVDSTGKGEPIYDRMKYDFLHGNESLGIKGDVRVVPFNFNRVSKHRGYTVLQEEIRSGRATFPHGDGAKRMRKVRRFYQQASELVKKWKGKYMVVEAPSKKDKSSSAAGHDDYPDSWMMLCWLVNGKGDAYTEQEIGFGIGKSLIREASRSADRYFGSKRRSSIFRRG